MHNFKSTPDSLKQIFKAFGRKPSSGALNNFLNPCGCHARLIIFLSDLFSAYFSSIVVKRRKHSTFIGFNVQSDIFCRRLQCCSVEHVERSLRDLGLVALNCA